MSPGGPRRVAIVLVTLVGCALDRTGLGSEARTGTDAAPRDGGSISDAATRDAATGDAAPDVDGSTNDGGAQPDSAPPDDAGTSLGPWGVPAPIPALVDPASDDDPCVTGDVLELYFNSNRSGVSDIWVSTRTSRSDPWGAPSRLSINSGDADGTPEISADGLSLMFASYRPGGMGEDDIWVTTRRTRGSSWRTPQLVTELNSAARDISAHVNAGGRLMVLGSTRSGVSDLFLTSRSSTTATWSTPAPIAEINTAMGESAGWLGPSARLLYFTSSRTGSMGADIWMSTRPTRADPFAPPTRVDELSGPGQDADPSLSIDLRYIVFERDGEIYEASR